MTVLASRSSTDRVLFVVLAAAFLLRLFLASSMPYLPDEAEIAIPLAESISFAPASLNLPIRGPHHPALPYYFVKASRSLLGPSPLGYRFVHILAGLLTILIVFRIAQAWSGVGTARWAAALLAFNEYHLGVSAYATAKGPHLMFVACAMYAFTRFLTTERRRYLYLTAALTGLAFYSKEHSALLLPVFFLTLCQPRHRHWLLQRDPYLAGVIFLGVVAADITWNFSADQGAAQHTYRDQLSRLGGLGFTIDHVMFFMRDATQHLSIYFTGLPMHDGVHENPSMNSVLGALLLGAVASYTLRRRIDGVGAYLLIQFWVILGFFVLVRPGVPLKPMDPVAWYWVDATLFPAVIVTGHVLTSGSGLWRTIGRGLAAAGVMYAVWWATLGGFLYELW